MVVIPFGTATLRARVLEAWTASPSRFREDANAEEDAALGAYRDRLLVELIQNAVDAATAAGMPARVRVRLSSGLLEVANTGAPLTAAGVEALSTLRASAKRDVEAVGRFGAGFAAVLAVTDTPSILSRSTRIDGGPDVWRGVGWSRSRTADLVRGTDATALHGELDRRAGAVPVLRLPFDLTEVAEAADLIDVPDGPAGYDTVVRLPLRDEAARATARALIAAFDPTLPLVLRGLEEIVIEMDGATRVHRCAWEPTRPGPDGSDLEVATVDGTRWRGCVLRGGIPAELLADRPVEERGRTGYTARAMVPDGGWPAGAPQVVRAPQPTDEAVGIPALISVDLPLDPSRRHTVPGPLRDWLTDRLAAAVAALAVHLGTAGSDHPGPDPLAVLDLVPTGLPRGEVDGRLRDRLLALLPEAPFLPGGRMGRDCVVLDLGPATDTVTALLRTGADVPAAAGAAAARDDSARDDSAGDDDGAGHEDGAGDDEGIVVDGLLPAEFAVRRRRPALDLLGVRRLDTSGVVEVLRGVHRAPSWWAGLYPLLLTAPDRDALGALPIPVVDVPDLDDLRRASAFGEPGPAGTGPGRVTPGPGSGEASPDATTTPPSRMVTGPRGALLPTPELDVVALARSGLPLRVVHPDACTDAARDALRTLGSADGTPAGVLRDPAVREAVTRSDPDDDPDELHALADGVLALVRGALAAGGHDGDGDGAGAGAGAGDGDGEEPGGPGVETEGFGPGRVRVPSWLSGLLLPELGGGFAPAAELVVADGQLDLLLADDAPFGTLAPRYGEAWPGEVLEAVGVLRTFGVLRAKDVTLDPDEPVLLELDDSDTWVEEVYESSERATGGPGAPTLQGVPVVPGAPLVLGRFAAVRDLELVDPDAWPDALAELARPPLRRVVLGPEPSYTRWWLARHVLLPTGDGSDTWLPPGELVLPGADPLLTGLFAPAAPLPGVDEEFLRRLGCRLALDDVLTDPEAVVDLLDRLGDADREIGWPAARTLYIAAVSAAGLLGAEPGGSGPLLDPPLTVRTPIGVFRSGEVAVIDAPDLLAAFGADHPILRIPLDRAAEAAHVLGLRLASELDGFRVLDGAPVTRTVMVAASRVVLDQQAVLDQTAADGSAGASDTDIDIDTDLAAVPGAARPLTATYRVHPQLWISSPGGQRTRVSWRVVGGIGGEIHVDAQAGTDALARALAWQAGQWERRHGLAAALRDPDGAQLRQAEDDLDDR
ncbi:sacsin N-terminal ATP-binding-like domain-containing protein [Parafrankia elaeagni]|uniref:sacsin N-terminal ATP-binding-like domain-containing protein n=1 Tax=Parafrankia elaeagni TaxID=222534 RepID=UPI0003A341F0|nr:molecular chaperone Hsp90 [Parafrankia elaeagni]